MWMSGGRERAARRRLRPTRRERPSPAGRPLRSAVCPRSDRAPPRRRSAMYGSPKCEGVTTNCFIEKMDLFFLVVFTVEFLCKVSAMGFIGKHTYLDDAWNKVRTRQAPRRRAPRRLGSVGLGLGGEIGTPRGTTRGAPAAPRRSSHHRRPCERARARERERDRDRDDGAGRDGSTPLSHGAVLERARGEEGEFAATPRRWAVVRRRRRRASRAGPPPHRSSTRATTRLAPRASRLKGDGTFFHRLPNVNAPSSTGQAGKNGTCHWPASLTDPPTPVRPRV